MIALSKIRCGWDHTQRYNTLHFLSEVPASLYAVWMFEQDKRKSERAKALSLTESTGESGNKYWMFPILSGSVANSSRWECVTCYFIRKIIRWSDFILFISHISELAHINKKHMRQRGRIRMHWVSKSDFIATMLHDVNVFYYIQYKK